MMTSATQNPLAARTPDSAHRTGCITLVRHGRPALSRKCWLTSEGYRDWWRRYDLGGLQAGQTPPPELVEAARKADAIFVSTLPRAQETARAVADKRDIVTDAIFVEAPLPPPHTPSWFKMPPRLWGVTARIWWHLFNHNDGQESRREAEQRADRAAQLLIEEAEQGADVLVLAHGYFNHMIGQKLKAYGWHLTLDQGFKYWCQRRFEKS